LSRDDCTLPQLHLGALNGLLAAIMSHFRAVLSALFPEKCQKIGTKRKNQNHSIKPNSTEEENIYQINFKKVKNIILIQNVLKK